MFRFCHELKEIKGLDKYNTSNVLKMNDMFGNCHKIEYLNLSSFDTSYTIDIEGIFNKCYKLKEIKGIENLNTSEITTMSARFQECNELESRDLSCYDNSYVIVMYCMFNEFH